MEDLVREVESLTNQLEDLRDADKDLRQRIVSLESRHQTLIRDLVEAHGWDPITVDGQKYLPFQHYYGEYGIRKI